MKHPKLTAVAALVLGGAVVVGCAVTAPAPAPAEADALTAQIVQASFHDKGIVKVDEALAPDDTLAACAAADVAGHPIDPALARRLEVANMKTVQWPADGKFIGDWKEGEKIAQSGRGRTWRDKAGAPNGGNCYNCHQISKEEISFGTIGPSLYQYGKLRGVTDLDSPQARDVIKYTWGKIWNSKAYNACSNMPRAGAKGILTQDQIRHIVALLLDPQSPVNR